MKNSPVRVLDPPARRRRRWPWVALGLFALFVVLVLDLAWAGSQAVEGLQQASDGLQAGGDALKSGDIAAARNDFASATSAGTEADDALGHPAITLVGWVPGLGDEVDAARRGAAALVFAAQGGTAYADAADAAEWDGSTLPGFSPGGRFDTDALARAAPSMGTAAELLGRADAELVPVDAVSLEPPLDRLVGQAKDEIHTRATQASIAAGLVRLLPPMLGADAARTYLLVTLSPSDPRGAGGYPGVYGLLHVDGHELSLSNLTPTTQIPKVRPVPGPAEAKRAWAWTGIDRIFWDTTYTPDFPTAAGFMKGIWEAGGGKPVDGVIAGDPALMASLLRVVGVVRTPAWPETITPSNVQQIVGADVYKTTSQTQSNEWQVSIGSALWDAVLTRPWPIRPMATAMSEAVDGGHLQVWSTRADEQGALGELGVTGAFVPPTDAVPRVTFNGFTANRAGYFAATSTRVTEVTDDEGRAVTTVTVTVKNRAPDAPASILLGRSPSDVSGMSLGTFGTDVNIYISPGATVTSFRVNGRDQEPYEWNELGAHGVSWAALIGPGKSAVVEVVYEP